MKVNEGILKINQYVSGKPIEEVSREFQISEDKIIKLASNENPNGLSLKVIEAINKSIYQGTRYPDGNGYYLKNKLSTKYHIKPEMITLGSGSNEVLDLIARVFLNEQTSVIFSEYAFIVYPVVADIANAEKIVVPAKNYAHDLDLILQSIKNNTKVIFLANPNNPTGTRFTIEEFKQFLDQVPKGIIVVLDEAYVEYCETQNESFHLLSKHSNLIICRTFSKAYGLASLRIGFSVSSVEIANFLNRVRAPFNVTNFGLVGACAILDDEQYLQKTIQLNKEGLNQLENGFDKLNLNYIKSFGNFISVDVGDAKTVNLKLLQKGIIVRPLDNYNMNTFLRVSVGAYQENQIFLDNLNHILKTKSI